MLVSNSGRTAVKQRNDRSFTPMLSAIWLRRFQYAFLAIIVTTVGFSLYQWNASRASTQKTAPNNGLVGYWSFDENTGTQAGDASGNNNTGTLTNGPTWTTGKLGQAINFDGTNDYVNTGITSNTNFSNTTFSVSAWFKTTVSTGVIIAKQDSTAGGWAVNFAGSSLSAVHKGTAGGNVLSRTTTATGLNDGNWHHVAFTMTTNTSSSAGQNIDLYLDGALNQGSLTNTAAVVTVANAVYIGDRYNTSIPFIGSIDEVRIYNRALSGTEITNLYNLGAEKLNVSPVSNLTSGLVGYWTFDGKDTPWSSSSAGTATDRSGNSNTGTLTNMSRTTSPAEGKLGQALTFDGVDDEITTATDKGNGSSLKIFTLSTWFKTSAISARKIIGIEANQTGTGSAAFDRDIYVGTDGKVYFRVYDGVSRYTTSAGALNDGNWHHAVGVSNGDNETIQLYVDGVLQQTTAIGTVWSSYTSSYWRIGGYKLTGLTNGGGDGYFAGSLDEVRIYNRALSAGEIQSLYDLGASDKVNSSVSQNQGTGRLDSGLVGYWKLDDASGTTATDSSVNAFNGTLTNGPTWGTGKIGGDVVFDGTDDYIDLGNRGVLNLTNNFSISVWLNINNISQGSYKRIFGRSEIDGNNRPVYLEYDYVANQYRIIWRNAGTFGASAGKVLTGVQWQHFVATFKDGVLKSYSDGALISSSSGVVQPPSSSSNSYIGQIGGYYFPGSIDEVRVYDRVLSDDEVSQLYRLTAPTAVDTSLKGYWSFDGSATNWTSSSSGTVSDLSGSSNTGTLTNMSRATSPAEGKLGQALTFDGVNDYISTTTNYGNASTLTTITMGAWFKTSAASGHKIVGLEDTQTGTGTSSHDRDIYMGTNGKVYLHVFDGGPRYAVSSNTYTDGNWHQAVAVIVANVNMILYIDGILQQTTSISNPWTAYVASYWRIGSYKLSGNTNALDGYFTGSIDDVRIYNRVLSATEISALYNSGR